MRKSFFCALVAIFLVPNIGQSEQLGSRGPMPILKDLKIESMVEVPMTGIQMVEAQGKVFFISENGRYVFRGALYDMWDEGRQVVSTEDLREKSSRIDLKDIGLNLDDLFTLDFGNGEKEVAVFVSPGCPVCKEAIAQMTQVADQYRFRLIPLPGSSETSQKHLRQLICSAEKDPEQALQALMTEEYAALPGEINCDVGGAQRSLVTARMFGVDVVPFFIGADGRIKKGLPKDLESFLGDEQ